MTIKINSELSCKICGSNRLERLRSKSIFFPSHSENRILPNHKNYLCNNCGVVSMLPQPDQSLLDDLYKSTYRNTNFAIALPDDNVIDLPIQFPESAQSFARFQNFIPCYEAIDGGLNEKSFVVDLGGYQGMFLYGMRAAYGVEGCVLDFNENGISHARDALGFNESRVIDSPFNLNLSRKADLVTMVHAFEHMTDPVELLQYIHSDVLIDDGYLFIEVPNLFGAPLCDPTHMFMYSEDSLRYVVEKGGFEVIKSYKAGSKTADFGLSNSELVIGCIAKKMQLGNHNGVLPSVVTVKSVNQSYRKHSRQVLVSELRNIFKRLFRLIYFISIEYGLALLPGHLDSKMRWLKKKISFRLN